jgi:four helix bundle protein
VKTPAKPRRSVGTAAAIVASMVSRYQDLIAWQTAELFKEEVVRLVETSVAATRDFKFRSQILEAASGVSSSIVEGFLRFRPREFAHFLDYALGSLGEAELRLHDGIRRGYFEARDCEAAFHLARRCLTASVRLKRSQERFGDGRRPPRPQSGRRPAKQPKRKRPEGPKPDAKAPGSG